MITLKSPVTTPKVSNRFGMAHVAPQVQQAMDQLRQSFEQYLTANGVKNPHVSVAPISSGYLFGLMPLTPEIKQKFINKLDQLAQQPNSPIQKNSDPVFPYTFNGHKITIDDHLIRRPSQQATNLYKDFNQFDS